MRVIRHCGSIRQKQTWINTEETSFHLQPVPWEANRVYYEKEDQPGKHPYHEAGVYYIQEPSAMAPAAYLDAQPGEKVLDLCAAPGAKVHRLRQRCRERAPCQQ